MSKDSFNLALFSIYMLFRQMSITDLSRLKISGIVCSIFVTCEVLEAKAVDL